MKVDLPLHVPGEALGGVAQAARRAEEAGMDGVSCSELSSDPILQLTVAAGATSRVELLSNIVVAFARSPMTLAVQGRAIQEYSDGRLILGLGSQIKPHIERRFSMPWSAPAARMAEYISALRTIWHSWETGEKLDFRGDFYSHTLMTPMFTPASRYPAPRVFLAAVGERMTETAGKVADGLLLHAFTTPRYLREVTLPALARGRGERPEADVDVVSSTFVVSGRNEEEYEKSRRLVCAQIAFYGSTPAYLPVLALHGWGQLGLELNRLSKQPDPDKWQRMGELITDDVLAEFALIGEPDSIGAAMAKQYGGIVGRYEVNTVGLPDPELAVAVARSVQRAAAAQ
ncbi:MAG TPA: TIGR03617 family F420-dependent LLM class oxidoreductase [Jatrophihabitans sp.]|nr:TIGR03617 family F420-dependent LLM class oxidoreductase [Jatrophihabitans sp.]